MSCVSSEGASSANGSGLGPNELNPYGVGRIEHDRVWYGQYVTEGARFYDATDEHVYEIVGIENGGDVFTLQPCAVGTPPRAEFETPIEQSGFVDNVCALSGAMEAGDLIHLDAGVLRRIESSAYLTIGELTVRFDGVEAEADPLLSELDPPNGPAATDLTKLSPVLDSFDGDVKIYAPISTARAQSPQQSQGAGRPSARRGEDVETEFFSVQPFSRWTFEDDTIRSWVESHFEPGDTVLNACAGKIELSAPRNGEIIRNDVNPERDADFHVDVAELASVDELAAGSINKIIFDPPWSLYQANLRYQGEHVTKDGVGEIDLSGLPFETPTADEKDQIGHSRLAKEGFDHLLAPGGKMIELTFHGTAMPNRLGYEQVRRAVFNPLGEAKAVIGSVDQKVEQTLSAFY
jgi:hypothetical protein